MAGLRRQHRDQARAGAPSRTPPSRSSSGPPTSTRPASTPSPRSTSARCSSPRSTRWTRRSPSCAAGSPTTCSSARPPTSLGQLVEGQLIQPLNHSYIPNIAQAWPDYTNPFYDQKWQYTVPYTIYTTGISWRKDLVHENPYAMANAWAMPWQPKYRGRVAILDDYREGICLGLMKNGIFNLNTTDYQQIALARQSLQELSGAGQPDHQQQRLLRRPRRPDLDHQRLVGRHGRRRVLHAQGRQRRRGRLLGPDRRPLPGQQRHDGGAEVVGQPGARPTCSSTTCSTCRTRSRTSPGTATCSRSTG